MSNALPTNIHQDQIDLILSDLSNLEYRTRVIESLGYSRAGVNDRLLDYLDLLKDSGCGRRAAAASIGIGYDTVMNSRAASPEFKMLEDAAVMSTIQEVENALFAEAKARSVGAIALFLKHRGEYVDKIEITATNELPIEAYSAETRQLMLKDQLAFAAKVKGNGK